VLYASDIESDLETVTVSYKEIAREYRFDGRVEAVHRTTMSAQTTGQVKKIMFDVDDYVEKNALVLQLSDKEQAAKLDQAKAKLKEALARFTEAEDENKRIVEIYAKKLVAKQAVDKASAALKATRASMQAAQAGLDQAQEQYAYTQIRAPYAGIVTKRFIEVGEMASPGKPLMSGLSLERLRVEVDVPQNLVAEVRNASHVTVVHNTESVAEVTEVTVFPFADEQTHTFRVRLDLVAGDYRLFPGMFVKAVFNVGQQHSLVIPASAVVYRSEVTAVYIINDQGEIGLRVIRPGRIFENGSIMVLAGLNEGDRVALDPIAAGVLLKQARQNNDQ